MVFRGNVTKGKGTPLQGQEGPLGGGGDGCKGSQIHNHDIKER